MKDGVIRPPNSVDTTSKSLLKRIKSGDQAAWQQLVFLHGPIVSFWINRSKLQSDDARDVSQEVFLAIVRNIERFERTEGASKFRRWLKVITHSKIADHFRRLQRTNTVDAELRCDLDEQHRPDSFNFIHENDEGSVDENAVIAQSAVALIRPEFRENTWQSFWLTVVEGKNATEVAALLGITGDAVRKNKSRVLARLQQVLLSDVGF